MFIYNEPIYFPNRKIRARLTCDLTRYGSDLIQGAECHIIDWDSSYGENFVVCRFKHTEEIDILFKSLEILDKNYIKYVERREQEELQQLPHVSEAVLYQGSRGGFRYFYYAFPGKKQLIRKTINSKEKALHYVRLLKSLNIPVRVQIV